MTKYSSYILGVAGHDVIHKIGPESDVLHCPGRLNTLNQILYLVNRHRKTEKYYNIIKPPSGSKPRTDFVL